jgi:uncharacterized protein with PQ loop repeat
MLADQILRQNTDEEKMKSGARLLITQTLGYVAAIVGTSMMVPQIWKIVASGKAQDLSLGMAVLYCINCALWLVYGKLIRAWPVTIANAISLAIGLTQFVLKKKYG